MSFPFLLPSHHTLPYREPTLANHPTFTQAPAIVDEKKVLGKTKSGRVTKGPAKPSNSQVKKTPAKKAAPKKAASAKKATPKKAEAAAA